MEVLFMNYPKPFVKLIAEVVAMVSSNILPTIQAAELAIKKAEILAGTPDADVSGEVSTIQSIKYKFGTYTEIQQYISETQNDPGVDGVGGKWDLMPMVCLFMPFGEQHGSSGGYYYDATFDMGIFYYSEAKYNAADGFAKVFEPILLPIYYDLIESFKNCGFFAIQDERAINHQKIDLPFGTNNDGKGDANIFGELLGAVKLNGVTLRVL